MAESIYSFTQGSQPLLVSIPHSGTQFLPGMDKRLTREGRMQVDCDWELHRLYDFLEELDVSIIKANYSRYVVDLNRGNTGEPLYSRNVTPLLPTHSFAGDPLYLGGKDFTVQENACRIRNYWQPYHGMISTTLRKLREKHSKVALFDCHSIVSTMPKLFHGRLPDFNLGSRDDQSCDPILIDCLYEALAGFPNYILTRNGRFKGGFITAHYGNPARGIHAWQLELAQATYASRESPFLYSTARAQLLRPALRAMLEAALRWLSG